MEPKKSVCAHYVHNYSFNPPFNAHDFPRKQNKTTKTTCLSKDNINKRKKEKIFVNHISGKGFIPRIHKQLLQLNNKIDKQPI